MDNVYDVVEIVFYLFSILFDSNHTLNPPKILIQVVHTRTVDSSHL